MVWKAKLGKIGCLGGLSYFSRMKNKHPTPVRDVFGQHAEAYRQRFWDVSLYTASLQSFCEALKSGAAVLEVGCGPGNVTSFLLELRPDLDILATDFAPEMVEIAAREVPAADTMVLDTTDLAGLEKTFDGFLAGFVLPYLDEMQLKTLVGDAAALLADDGVIYISSMIENETQRSGIRINSYGEAVFMYYHRLSTIKELLVANGFTIVFEDIATYPSGDTITSDLTLIGQKLKG